MVTEKIIKVDFPELDELTSKVENLSYEVTELKKILYELLVSLNNDAEKQNQFGM